MSGFDDIALHLKLVYSILLLVERDFTLSRQLSSFSDRHKRCSKTKSNDRTQQEPSSVKTYNDVGWGTGVFCVNVMHEMSDEFFEGFGISEQGEDVEKGDSL